MFLIEFIRELNSFHHIESINRSLFHFFELIKIGFKCELTVQYMLVGLFDQKMNTHTERRRERERKGEREKGREREWERER